jgi:hypothetical protein
MIGNAKLGKLHPLQLQTLYREKLDSGLSLRRVQFINVTMQDYLTGYPCQSWIAWVTNRR